MISGFTRGAVASPFELREPTDERVRSWLEAQRGASDVETAENLFAALRKLVDEGRILADLDDRPKARLPRTGADILEAALLGEKALPAGCYELTSAFVAAARWLGLDVRGYERRGTGSGQIGHVVAGLPTDPPRLFDLQQVRRPTAAGFQVLRDRSLAAHHLNHLAVARLLGGDPGGARAAIDRALELAPWHPSFLANRAVILLELGKPEAAFAEIGHALALDPDVPFFYLLWARIEAASGRVERAQAILRWVTAFQPSFDRARLEYAWLLFSTGGEADGVERLVALARRGVEDALPLATVAYLRRGERDKAESLLRSLAERGDADIELSKRLLDPRGQDLADMAPNLARFQKLVRD